MLKPQFIVAPAPHKGFVLPIGLRPQSLQVLDLGKPLVHDIAAINQTLFTLHPRPSNTAIMFGITPLKKFPTPVARPLAPFFIAGLVIAYGINAGQNAMMQSDEWKNDPRNPNAKSSH
ncbi:ATP synthase j chain-domain-containing protein [Xylariaceae sp. FL0255]|nr:ATP synthase j chain-domain-containing protein [Xylariaceae sp. FL0255]